MGRSLRALGALAALACLACSCAYYNTYYLAKKYYLEATGGLPYAVEKPLQPNPANYQRAVDFSKKVVTNYPKSKWADDAYLMWARSLLGKDDPLQTVTMLQDFGHHFPNSPLSNEATFYLGVAFRQGRKYRESLVPLEEFLEKEPKHDLAPYAHLERARAFMSLTHPEESARAASAVIEGYPKSELIDAARSIRAEALLASGDAARARLDFQALGLRSQTDDQRFDFLLREADCLEVARDYAGALALLNDAIAHETAPAPTQPGAPVVRSAAAGGAADRYGRLKLRIGTVHLLAGKSDQALTEYKSVLVDYPKSALAAEAQYRIGYAYETVLDDFETARQEYGKVRDLSAGSAFANQATQRLQSLDRLARFRNAGSDSLGKQTEAGFLLAEQYLFQLGKPERALEAYQTIARDHPGTDAAAKAMVAEAWVLRRKMDRASAADSLLWKVVRDHPATEAQLAARDYLEGAGQMVPADLIRMPERLTTAEPVPELTAPPAGRELLGAGVPSASSLSAADSIQPPAPRPSFDPATAVRPSPPPLLSGSLGTAPGQLPPDAAAREPEPEPARPTPAERTGQPRQQDPAGASSAPLPSAGAGTAPVPSEAPGGAVPPERPVPPPPARVAPAGSPLDDPPRPARDGARPDTSGVRR